MSDTAIKTLLSAHKISQRDAALILGVTQQAISLYCSGVRPTPDEYMQKLAAVTGEVGDKAASAGWCEATPREEYNAHIWAMERHCKSGGDVYDDKSGRPMHWTAIGQPFPYKLYIEGYGRGGKLVWGRVYIAECPGVSRAAIGSPRYNPHTKQLEIVTEETYDIIPVPAHEQTIGKYWSSHSQQKDKTGQITWQPVPAPFNGRPSYIGIPLAPIDLPPPGKVHMLDRDLNQWVIEPEPQ